MKVDVDAKRSANGVEPANKKDAMSTGTKNCTEDVRGNVAEWKKDGRLMALRLQDFITSPHRRDL